MTAGSMEPNTTHRYRGPIRALVLDWAGTVLDHGCLAPTAIFARAFAARGVEVTDAEVRGPMGMGKWEHIQTMLRSESVAARWQQVHGRAATDADVDAMYAEFLPLQIAAVAEFATLIPGAVGLLDEARRRHVRVGSSTGYPREVMDVLAPLAADAGYAPDTIVTASDLEVGRPAPWEIFENMRRLDVWPPAGVVKIDDTVAGIESGLRAGVWTVGVSRTGNLVGLDLEATRALDRADLQARVAAATSTLFDAGAHFVVPSVAELGGVLDRINALLREGERP